MTTEPKPGDLKVWWIPQVPGKPFEVPVATIDEAKKLLDVLAKYDDFQFANRIKPDYCNVGGLVVFEDGAWLDWTDADGNDVEHTTVLVVSGEVRGKAENILAALDEEGPPEGRIDLDVATVKALCNAVVGSPR